MKKEWIFDRVCGEQIAIYLEDGKLIDVAVESEKQRDLIGTIYKGRVSNVVAGMQAAFVSCGLDKNCYLPLDENLSVLSSYDGEMKSAQPLVVHEGDELLVQVVKPPRGSKGAKVTTALSFVGKHLIYLPNTDFVGISRKILDPVTREKLLSEAEKLRSEGEGFIMRTVASTATKRQLKTERDYLKRVYQKMLDVSKSMPVGSIVYSDYALPMKILRDSLGTDVDRITVGNRDLYEQMLALVRLRSDLSEKILVLYTGKESLATHFKYREQLLALASRTVEIGNGANLVIDRTEAMTVIDVNTGKYTGMVDLESTATRTNVLAAREIARQVRLRNLSGMIAVDFIDMTEDSHREQVRAELESCLLSDKAKCRVLPMNDLCVVLFTRKRTIHDLSSFLLKECPHCTRQGFVLSNLYMAMRIRSAICDLFADGYQTAIIELNRGLMEYILAERLYSTDKVGEWADKRVYFIPHRTYHEEQFTIRGDNSGVLTLPDTAQILY